jgi:hypothetical protein
VHAAAAAAAARVHTLAKRCDAVDAVVGEDSELLKAVETSLCDNARQMRSNVQSFEERITALSNRMHAVSS